jgi:hypothetical protein
LSRQRQEYNPEARKLQEEELFRRLRECFTQRNPDGPSKEQESGLREAANWIATNLATLDVFEEGINEDTWDPAEGARAVFGPM